MQIKSGESTFFRCSRAANLIVSDGIWPKFKRIHALMYGLVAYNHDEKHMKIKALEWLQHCTAIF